MPRQPKAQSSKKVETFKHEEDKRKNIPTAEYQSVMAEEEKRPIRVAYERRNRDLDPQLVWRGKDEQDWSDLMVSAPPLYIQEKVHPRVLVEDLRRETEARAEAGQLEQQIDLFADFNGLPKGATGTEFYQHEANWTNRMILGDSLQVMASLAEREGLRGKVQCIYLDPPYGIRFNSNFQWSTTSRDVKDGRVDQITREPEQVKAFRDTWRDGIHSYLTYLRDRLTVARDLLSDSGSIFVQIGDENVHRVRSLMDEIFGEENFISLIFYTTTGGFSTSTLSRIGDYIIWYSRSKSKVKYRQLFLQKTDETLKSGDYRYVKFPDGSNDLANESNKNLDGIKIFRLGDMTGQGSSSEPQPFFFQGKEYNARAGNHWKSNYPDGMRRLGCSSRIWGRKNSLGYTRFLNDFPAMEISNMWDDTSVAGTTQGKWYVVQTNSKVIERCILMATDPGDLVVDPTCGGGTTAYVAEQWGRRWITIDTSRVALALARARIMGARYLYYLLSDSPEGQKKEADINRTIPSSSPTYRDIRQGFVYDRVPHITLKSIANNTEIDVIWEKFQTKLEPIREQLNQFLKTHWEEWEIPREADKTWSDEVRDLHSQWWKHRIQRQKEIDASIAAKADQEFLYDKPFENKAIVRVAGPFTVESLSPYRVLAVDENDNLIDPSKTPDHGKGAIDFATIILENLKTSGVQQAHKEDKINFTNLSGWAGRYICAEGHYLEGEQEKRAGIFIGPEFGTVSRPDLVGATREAGDAGFDVLIACAFSFDAHSADFTRLGNIPVLKARMNADLHMANDLKNTGAGNLFVIFGEPDIEIQSVENQQIQVKLNGVDVFRPQSGEVESSGADGIACWFIDTDYNEESFFVRHAYFLGASDPYKSLKTTLKAEIDEVAWESLNSDLSRPFPKPKTGRIAVKVINYLGDEVMKVFSVE